MTECIICFSCTRTTIKCLHCSSATCTPCVKHYINSLLEKQEIYITCPKPECRKPWNDEFLFDHLPRRYMNKEMKLGREAYYLQRELALLPATQELAQLTNASENAANRVCEQREIIRNAKSRIYNIGVEQQHIFNNFRRFGQNNQENKTDIGQQFVCACPVNTCEGFIAKSYRCGMCEVKICSSCRRSKDEHHDCNPDDVASVQALKKETKPCPKCAAPIFKIDGCFALDSPILLWDRSIVNAQDIRVGDTLLGDDQKERTVIQLYSGVDDLFDIRQDTGDSYRVNSQHQLCLATILPPVTEENDVVWYDTDIQDCRIETFSSLANAQSFWDALPSVAYLVEMPVIRYVQLSSTEQNCFTGYRMIDAELIRTCITVIPMGRGPYAGWTIGGNHRFCLPDMTVTKNCSQMWCLHCKVFFNWRTMVINQGTPHNPEYYRYLRENPNGDLQANAHIPCGQGEHIPPAQSVISTLRLLIGNKQEYKGLARMHHAIAHFINTANHNDQQGVLLRNQEYRVQLLRKKLDQSRFKTLVQRSEKAERKLEALTQVTETTELIAGELYRRVTNATTLEQLDTCVDMILALAKQTNECLARISRRYECVVPRISENNWTFDTHRYSTAKKRPRKDISRVCL